VRGSAGGSDPDPPSTGLESVPGTPGRQRFHSGTASARNFATRRLSSLRLIAPDLPRLASRQPAARPKLSEDWLKRSSTRSLRVLHIEHTGRWPSWCVRSNCRRVILCWIRFESVRPGRSQASTCRLRKLSPRYLLAVSCVEFGLHCCKADAYNPATEAMDSEFADDLPGSGGSRQHAL
jgi:hypothetical protein